MESEQRLKLRWVQSRLSMACGLIIFFLYIDYLAVTNHRAGGVLYVQEEDDFDRDHPCCLPESLARVNVDRVLDTYRVFLLDAI